jgi:hypothetical protein
MVVLFAFTGCNKDSSSSSGGSGTASASSGSGGNGGTASGPDVVSGTGDPDAVKTVQAEIAKRWVYTPDGWLSEFPSHVYIATGKRADAESYYRQLKQLTFEITADDISDSDKLNGVQFRALCQFKTTPMRIYNDPNSFGGKAWSQWQDSQEFAEQFRVLKKSGQWSCTGDCWLINGDKPGSSTIAQLK